MLPAADRVAAIIPAAGSGSRLGADVPKAFIELDGLTLLARSALAMSRVAGTIAVAAPPGYLERAARELAELEADVHIVATGKPTDPQLPAAEQARAYDGIVPELANVNPAAAAALLEKVSPDGRAGIGETIAAQWLETDPVAARAWLTKAPLPDEVKQRLLSQSPSPPPLPPLKQRP